MSRRLDAMPDRGKVLIVSSSLSEDRADRLAAEHDVDYLPNSWLAVNEAFLLDLDALFVSGNLAAGS